MTFSKSIAKAGASALALLAGGQVIAQTVPTSPDDVLESAGSEIIVTGTRVAGISVAESATPIKVLGEEALGTVGQPNLNQVLTQLVPSFTAQAFGGDTANLTLSARLRGLSPNHTLVLINGKRRHGTANLSIVSSAFQGSATADLDLIAPNAIKRIEVLEDGAAAQYGSDAIAGVINIILKDDNEGGDGYVTAGKNYQTGGDTYAGSLHLATKVGDAGFINVTAFHRFHNFTQTGGLDRRVTDATGAQLTTYSGGIRYAGAVNAARDILIRANDLRLPGFPLVNAIMGDAKSSLTNLYLNSGYDFGDVQAYAFGSYSKRSASSRQNVRFADTILGSPVTGVAGQLEIAGTTVPFPLGFTPRIAIEQDDYAFTGGLKGSLGALNFDFSTTYGQDRNLVSTLDSANRALSLDTGFTPRDFYDGSFTATEFTANADFTTEFDVGFTKPVNVAFGTEYRRNTYAIGSGDAASIYKSGPAAYPGFRPSDAGFHSRNNKSLYIDIAATPAVGLKIDAAVRYESYSDFGDNVIFKGTGRYDFGATFAVRGTVSTGFRAPTLAESFYSATNVSPTAAFVQLPANSAAAKLIGFQNLKPEKSTSYSLGLVVRPAQKLTITLDAYQVSIRDRIIGTGSIFGSGGAVNFPIVTAAILANGNVLDPTVAQTGITIFTNGADTRTRGVELTASYQASLGEAGSVALSLSGNYNETKITRLSTAPAALGGLALFSLATQSNLETASPKLKVIGSAVLDIGRLSATLRGTVFGPTSAQFSPNGGTYYRQSIPTTFIGDVEVGYELNGIKLSIGANNVFNKRPPVFELVPGTTNQTLVNGGSVLDSPLTFSPYGINGGYYYGRVNFKF